MSIANRLKKLEQTNPVKAENPQAREALNASLRTIYDRVGPQRISKTWLAQQSNATAISFALFGTLPLPNFLTGRLNKISKEGGTSGKLAKRVLEVAS